MSLPPDNVGEGVMFSDCMFAAFIVHLSVFMNRLSSLDETYKEYSLAPTNDLVRFWRSKVKVAAVHLGQIL